MWSAYLFFTLFIVAQVLAAALALVCVGTGGDAVSAGVLLDEANAVPVGISLLAVEGCLSLGLWWWIFRRKRFRLLSFFPEAGNAWKKRACGWKEVTGSVAAVLSLSVGLSLLLETLRLSDGGTSALFEAMVRHPLCLVLLCGVGPLAEELVFRAGMVRSLRLSGWPGWLSAAVSAAAFAAVHGNVAQGVPAFAIGVALGLLYLHAGSLWLCLPAHMANNTLAVALLLLPQREATPAGGLLGAALLAFGAFVLWTIMTKKEK